MLPKKIISITIIAAIMFLMIFEFFRQPNPCNITQKDILHTGQLEINKTLKKLLNQLTDLETLVFEKHTNDTITQYQKLNNINQKYKSKKINKHIITDHVEVDTTIEYDFIVLISSNLPHSDRRATIRTTWGNKTIWDKTEKQWKVIFVTGGSKNRAISKRVQREAEIYQDVLIEDVEEDFYALSKKVMIGLQWAHTNFNYKFILKCDDDIFVQIDRLIHMLEVNKDQGYIGQPMLGQPVERGGRYGLTKEEHPNNTFDPYCSGGAFLLSFETVNKIIPLFDWKKPLKIDDAYVGQLVHKADIKLFVEQGFFMWNRWCEYNEQLIISHPVKVKPCMDFMISHSMNENGRLINNDILNKKYPYTDEERKKL